MSFLVTIQKLWKTWDLRSFLLFSFSLQCILIQTASMRKRTSNKVWIALIWLTYLCADWSAYYAIGLIPSPRTSVSEYDKYADLHAFWAPFLLLHIGGPTTIAAFSLEDNETWRRSVLHLLAQVGLTLFIIYQAIIPPYRNSLLAPTLLMFVAAVTRYLERVLALYYASTNKFRNSAIEDLNHGKDFESLCRTPSRYRDRLSEVQMVKDSYILFQSYKRVFGDLPIVVNYDNIFQSENYFLKVLDPEEASREMEIQMNLAYDIFYTKTWLIVETKVGMILHMVSLCSELVALVLWALVDKEKYLPIDVRVTNTLVLGGIAVDVLSCFKLIFSDVMTPKLAKLKWVGNSYLLNKALTLKHHEFWSRWLMISRWSGTIPQFNLIHDFILEGDHKRKNWINYLIRPIRSVKLTNDVKRRVIEQIKYVSLRREREREPWADIGVFMNKEYMWEELKSVLNVVGLVDGLLFCHLATELLYKEDPNYKTDVAKQVSEFLMFHLFDENNSMVAQGVIRQILFDTNRCKWIRNMYMNPSRFSYDDYDIPKLLIGVSEGGLAATAHKSMVMLTVGLHIKDHLMKSQRQNTATIIEDMWVGLLCKTAMQSTGRAHLEKLSNGGEFLTMVWLLLTHVLLTPNIEANLIPRDDVD